MKGMNKNFVTPSKDQLGESWTSNNEKRCQPKVKGSIFNQVIAENLLPKSCEKAMPIQVQEASRTAKRYDQNRTSPQHIILKTISTEKKKRILKAT
jgi:ribosomal protein L39E